MTDSAQPRGTDGAGATAPVPSALPAVGARSATDVLAGLIRLRLGGKRYVLDVLPIEPEERWREALEATLGAILASIDSGAPIDEILGELQGFTVGPFVDALYAYDRGHDRDGNPTRDGVLPPRDELLRTVPKIDVIIAVFEVWSATSPLVAIGLAMTAAAATRGA